MSKGTPAYSVPVLDKKSVHQVATSQFARVAWSTRLERDYMISDRRFCYIAGAQWEGALFEQFADKPRFEVNKVQMSVMRIANEYRNNRMTVDFKPSDGSDADALADFLDGAYRATEFDSGAEEAYDNAFDEGTSGGMGAWRLMAVYEDEGDPECDHQIVRIEPITDADQSVYFDLQAKRQDKSDANYCFVITSMTHESYKDTYGDTDFSTWPVATDETTQFDWYTPDVVYVAEYYVVQEESYEIHIYEDEDGEEFKSEDDRLKLESSGNKFIKTRKIKKKVIDKYVLSGANILEGPERIPGKHIPIVPYYGKRNFIDNLERCAGHVRLAKDAQRLKNIQLSRLGELSILSPYEKPIFTPEQVAGLEERWANDNLKNYPYQLINQLYDPQGNPLPAGAQSYTKPPTIPPALAALLQITETDMQDLLGNQQAGEVLQPNTSGDAVSLVQTRLDMQTAIYLDNMKKAVKRSGEIWLSIVQDIYVEKGRKIKTVSKTGKKKSVKLDKKVLNAETGVVENEIDLSNAKCDVNVTVGPSSDSKRAATFKSTVALLAVTVDEELKTYLGLKAAYNMEGEGMEGTRDYARARLVAMGAEKPTEEEAKEIAQAEEKAAQQPPSPEDQYILAEKDKSEALAIKAAADADYSVAKTATEAAQEDKTVAETYEILAGIDNKNITQAITMLQAIDASQKQEDEALQNRQPPGGNGVRQQGPAPLS